VTGVIVHQGTCSCSAVRKGVDMAGRAARATTYHAPRPADLRRR